MKTVSDYGITMKCISIAFSACNVTLSSSSGTFTSPGYPADYPNYKVCQTTIIAPKGKRITLTFSTFELEKSLSCVFDYVAIIEGERKRKYCGKVLPPEYKSKGNSIMVKFESDSLFTGKGFNASFIVVGMY